MGSDPPCHCDKEEAERKKAKPETDEREIEHDCTSVCRSSQGSKGNVR